MGRKELIGQKPLERPWSGEGQNSRGFCLSVLGAEGPHGSLMDIGEIRVKGLL